MIEAGLPGLLKVGRLPIQVVAENRTDIGHAVGADLNCAAASGIEAVATEIPSQFLQANVGSVALFANFDAGEQRFQKVADVCSCGASPLQCLLGLPHTEVPVGTRSPAT